MSSESTDVSCLEAFVAEGLITDVLETVKSGKEATVYCCRASPLAGGGLLAAKVYRRREFRSFKRDAVYRQGRVILDARFRRAVAKKTRCGRAVQSGMWVAGEFETLKLLHQAGADVPAPVAQAGSAILMEYVGGPQLPAPALSSLRLAEQEARKLLDRLLQNVELFLACDRVHADLSAFNILYWQGTAKIIDFPQAVDPRFNPDAYALLRRDLENLCRYFARCGVTADAARLAERLWHRFVTASL